MLVPLDLSFLFLLARRCGLCYDSAKANRLRNGEMCQSMQSCKMFLKGPSYKVETRSYGKKGLQIITLPAGISPCHKKRTGFCPSAKRV